jgi:hypothetical protein
MSCPSLRSRSSKHAIVVAALIVALAPIHPAVAKDELGLYLGGAVGQSRVEADGSGFNAASFKENHSAFKVMAGLRPISMIGGELEYMDFGHPSGSLGGHTADATMKGAAAFGVLYLPVPVIDVFAKVGLARLRSTLNGVTSPPPACGSPCVLSLFQLNRADTELAAGAGVQFKIGSAALRGEYERFKAAGGNPGLLSLGFTWAF